MIRQFQLVDQVKAYNPGADEDLLNRAYVFSMKAHGAQTRASGDPYFSHPVEVASILTRYKLDTASIVTALLHDTVEDTVATLEDIETLFGQDIARLVDGVTKLSRIELQSDQTKQAENFRKLVLAMSEDLRVLMVKLADRLHNMRTLHYMKNADSRRRIAHETMEIYAPLAERIGMHEFKDELEDLAFKELTFDARESIVTRLKFLREQGGALVPKIIAHVEKTLSEGGVSAEVAGREKAPFSIWRKMQRKNVTFEQLSDIMAFRILVPTLPDCYRALGLIHCAYRVVPERFKDYISTPKPNGYQSLHTVIIGPERQRIEVQIRTREMHQVAEYGVAAHWSFKDGAPLKADPRQYRWLRELLDILEQAASPEDFFEHTKLEMFQDQVFSFTPKGDLIAMPQGATPVDFAYAIHSEVGDACVGAKVNGRLVPLRTILKNGDQVEVITSPSAAPSPTWEGFVVTGKARARIRRLVRTQQRDQYVNLGRSILAHELQQMEIELKDQDMEGVLARFNCETVQDLYAEIGDARRTAKEVAEAAFPKTRSDSVWANIVPIRRRKDKGKEQPISIRGLIPGMAVHYAGCCTPVSGDRIVGILTPGKGATVHTIDCESLEGFASAPERWLDLAWDAVGVVPDSHLVRINVVIENKPGSLGNVCMAIGQNEGNISNLRFTNRAPDFYEMMVDVDVHDLKQLTHIMAALRAVPAVNSVERARG
ncbi:MAG: bifunctional (p)ppGpp synthetase/guanosine-3',5'-bis(diphosphate) 3'-pyrophosphohydrolase [Alphaproteobacteria bacterium]|nr:bifunctional (p)ppGpp synthetase/guanosine-3',5'-bis(diphosphate) 3'-pyrophosphohydrolase [Alphaproteobacteria bacterium]